MLQPLYLIKAKPGAHERYLEKVRLGLISPDEVDPGPNADQRYLDCVVGPTWTFDITRDHLHTKDEVENIIKKYEGLEGCVLELVPDRTRDKIFEVFSIILSIIMFWKNRKCNNCGSHRVYEWREPHGSNENPWSEWASGAKCHRCQHSNWYSPA